MSEDRKGLLSWRVAAFFAANHDEELTVADMVVKWGCVTHTAQAALRSMERAGYVRCILTPRPGTPPHIVATAGPELLRTIGAMR